MTKTNTSFEGPNMVFFGTSDFSVTILHILHNEGLSPRLIVTTPDKPAGRKLVLTPSPVKEWAIEHGIPYIQPESLKDSIPKELKETPEGDEWDLFIVVSYGKIIPENILELSPRGALNVHPSLLPQFRGSSPIQSAILNDVRDTGVTIMLLDSEMDHGPIVAQATVTLEEWPVKASMLQDLLAEVGAELLIETIIPWINNDIQAEAQDHNKATYIEKIKKSDGEINLDDDPYQNLLKIYAYDIWPQAFFFIEKDGKDMRIKITDAQLNDGKLEIIRIIPEGKKEMDYQDFMRSLT